MPTRLPERPLLRGAVSLRFVATDQRDWPTVESCFTEPFLLDMTSDVGDSPSTMTPR